MKSKVIFLLAAGWALPASAADVIYQEPAAPAPVSIQEPAYGWSGLYVGGQLGASFGSADGGFTFDADNDGLDDDIDIFEDENAGFAGGVHVGYDQQFGNFVIGGIADISYIDADVNRGFEFAGDSYEINQEIDFFATARLRAGYAFDRFLVYGTGGLAFASTDTSFVGPDIAGLTYDTDSNESDVGYTVGAGAEYLLTDRLSLGLEYLYTDLGSNDLSFEGVDSSDVTINTGDSSSDFDFHTIWAKVSYRF